ncbi:MAG: hypothetical protein IT313_10125 [Anaerolineales bacterium]|nr:hypothetical protein [Anaerolineales bacterium]
MNEPLSFKPFGVSAFILFLLGWGGLIAVLYMSVPLVGYRWMLFALIILALTGTLLPIVYFFHRRFPADPPAEANVIVRQSVWFGVYGATLAWLQLGRLVTVYVILGLAGGLIAIEYFLRLREKARWKPPVVDDDQSS